VSHHIAQLSQHMLDATADREALAAKILARAVANGRFPTTRFRVEGSRVGASRILTEKRADAAVAQFGGMKVELVTREMWLAGEAEKLPACTTAGCLAAAGKVCKTKSGNVRAPHDCRLGVDEAKPTPASAAQNLIACIARGCGAKAGKPCQSPKGKNRMPHKVRIPKVAKPGALL
jgi:hypothetical protein